MMREHPKTGSEARARASKVRLAAAECWRFATMAGSTGVPAFRALLTLLVKLVGPKNLRTAANSASVPGGKYCRKRQSGEHLRRLTLHAQRDGINRRFRSPPSLILSVLSRVFVFGSCSVLSFREEEEVVC